MIKVVQELGKRAVEETVLCAAVWIDDKKKYNHQPKNIESGYIIAGFRHGTIYEAFQKFHINLTTCKQGFLTSHNRFLDRKEAMILAKKMNQVGQETIKDGTLFSEDLY